MLKRLLTESLRLEITWRLALSALVCAATIGATTVNYAFSKGNEVLTQAQQQTELQLRSYITYDVFMKKWDEKMRQDQEHHNEIIERLIRLEEKVGGREKRRGAH